jgi:hypothetical protein
MAVEMNKRLWHRDEFCAVDQPLPAILAGLLDGGGNNYLGAFPSLQPKPKLKLKSNFPASAFFDRLKSHG